MQTTSKDLIEKIVTIQKIIEGKLQSQSEESIVLLRADTDKYSELRDQMGFEKAIKKIVDFSNGKITARDETGVVRHSLRASDTDMINAYGLIGVRIHLENPADLDKYFEVITRKIEAENTHAINIDVVKTEIKAGSFKACSDGFIRFDDEVIKLTDQELVLCWLLIRKHGQIVTIDDIRDEIISAGKRKSVPNETISKYVSKLHSKLQKYSKMPVIFNSPKTGWRLEI